MNKKDYKDRENFYTPENNIRFVFIVLFCIIGDVFSIYAFTQFSLREELAAIIAFAVIFLFASLFLILAVLTRLRSFLYFSDDDGFVYSSGYSKIKIVPKNRITGFKRLDKVFVLYYKTPDMEKTKTVSVSEDYKSYYDFICLWIDDIEKDMLYKQQEAAITSELDHLRNDKLLSDEQIEKRLEILSGVAIALSVIPAILVFAIILLWQENPTWLFVALTAYPILMIFICYLANGEIKLIKEKTSIYPDVSIGVLISVIACYVISERYFTFSAKSLFVCCGVYLCLFIFLYVLFNFGNVKKDWSIIIVPFVLACFLSVSTVRIVNAVFDNSDTNVITATVIDKRRTGRKTKSYYLKVVPFEEDADIYLPKEIKVVSSFYNKVMKDSYIEVVIHSGALNVPWYTYRIKKLWKGSY